ncbi:MAG TPA: hypothetical protein VGW40_05280 [Allosphingosinicella sp.]|nr:hypothetical protein [Allosphingosinicella sp.]
MTGKSKKSVDQEATGQSQSQQQAQEYDTEHQADAFGNIEQEGTQLGNIEPE